jgi:DeoR/GlpR family transcriptional regulator of sugar metabolism
LLSRQRLAFILDRVRSEGAVRVVDLARELGVSDMTVRRDLELLHQRGLVEKVHGGATALSESALFEPGFDAKSSVQRREKAAIADAAAALVAPGMAIAVSAGTTTHVLARSLAEVDRLTVITNSIRVLETFERFGDGRQTVALTGGSRTPSDALVGPFAVSALRSVHVDLTFMGVHGMTTEAGFTTPNLDESEVDRALVDAARQLVVVADHTKWGVMGISSFARLDEADVLVTDDRLDADARTALEARVGRLVVVRTRTGRSTGRDRLAVVRAS